MKKRVTTEKLQTLTDKEKQFSRLWVENFFAPESKTNTEIAIAAGYAEDSAHQRAYENTTYRLKPHVFNYIEKLKEDFRTRNKISPEKHMARLHYLGKKAEESKMYGVSLNAEVYRGKMAGYYIEKSQIIQNEKTEEELEAELRKIEEQFGLLTSHEEGKKDEAK